MHVAMGRQAGVVLVCLLALSGTPANAQAACDPACQNGGICDAAYGTCNCAGTGFSGSFCQTPAGSPSNSSATSPSSASCPVSCYNGDCTQQYNSELYYCKCKTGYTGDSCNVQSASSPATSATPSTNTSCPVNCVNGLCTQQYNSNLYYCQCKSGYSGSACDSSSTPSSSSPTTAPASNTSCPVSCVNGLCTQQYNSDLYYCQCNSGFSGAACNTSSTPTTAPVTATTAAPAASTNQSCPVSCAHGTCTQQYNSELYYCQCNSGYTGSACDSVSGPAPASSGNSSQDCPVACLNGQCTQQYNSELYYCACNSGWNGASCASQGSPAVSPTPASTTASTTNQSCPVSCVNGKCSQQYNSDLYYCECNSGYSGTSCNMLATSTPSTSTSTTNQSCPVACVNGDCTQQYNSNLYYCACKTGYTGESCSALSPTGSPTGVSTGGSSCGTECHHGSCLTQSDGTAYCQCDSGFKGNSCNEIVSAATSSSPSDEHGSKLSGAAVFGIVVAVMVGLLAIGAAAFVLWRRRRTATFVKFHDAKSLDEIEISKQNSLGRL